MDFEDEKQAKIWILINQIARRNIEPFWCFQLLTERDKLKKLRSDRLKRRLKNLELSARRNGKTNDGSSGKELSIFDNSFIVAHGVSDEDDNNTHQSSREEIAKESGVSTETVAMMEQIDKKSKEGISGKKLITACARKQCHNIWTVWTENRELISKGGIDANHAARIA